MGSINGDLVIRVGSGERPVHRDVIQREKIDDLPPRVRDELDHVVVISGNVMHSQPRLPFLERIAERAVTGDDPAQDAECASGGFGRETFKAGVHRGPGSNMVAAMVPKLASGRRAQQFENVSQQHQMDVAGSRRLYLAHQLEESFRGDGFANSSIGQMQVADKELHSTHQHSNRARWNMLLPRLGLQPLKRSVLVYNQR